MTKLDEIQERITQMAGDTAYLPLPQEFFDVLSDITRELQRIDTERKAMDKVLIELAARDT